MAEYLKIVGGNKLSGEVQVAGSKNAALPLLISALLSTKKQSFSNVPKLDDIAVTLKLLRSLGSEVAWNQNTLEISTPEILNTQASYSLVKSLRASFWVLGPLLARAGKAEVALPGGDAIGSRPVDLHIAALEKLGAKIELNHGVVTGHTPNGLHGACLLYTSPSPRDATLSRMPSSA